jgi:hypothetical protein
MDDLSVVVAQYNPSVVCISESWLNANISDVSVQLSGFNLFRKDRLTGNGGGVAVYVLAGIQCHRLIAFEQNEFEVLWVSVRPKELPRPLSILLLAVVYCPPSYDCHAKKNLGHYLVRHLTNYYENTLMLGLY